MSAFTDTTLIKKLAELNSSQQSIQTLSLWLIHHRKHHEAIVRTWTKQIYTVSENRKLIFLYLANDVIQNSKKKGPEYGKEFAVTLPKVFKHIGETCIAEKLVANLRRILDIWKERGVYDTGKLEECRQAFEMAHSNALLKRKQATVTISSADLSDRNTGEAGSSVNLSGGSSSTSTGKDGNKSSIQDSKKNTSTTTASKRSLEASRQRSKKKRSSSSNSVKEKNSQSAYNSNDENGGGDSSYISLGDAPEPEELIWVLENMEHTASSDADVRERIAKLPQELSDLNHVNKLGNKQDALLFLSQVNEAIQIIGQYNGRLSAEMEQRGKLSIMLRDFHNEQKELLLQAEKRLDEYKKKLQKILSVQREIRDHLSNLPDLTHFSDNSGVLAPLPSPSDLFNIHSN